MSRQTATTSLLPARERVLPCAAKITARMSGGSGHYEYILFYCTIDDEGRIIRAMDIDGPQANSFVEIVPAITLELHKNERVERYRTGIFDDAKQNFSFCVRISNVDGSPEETCDLEGYSLGSDGRFHPCTQLPKPVMDEVELVLAAGAVRLPSDDTE